MHWIHLTIAVAFEVAVAICAGKAAGFTHRGWTLATLGTGALGTFFLSRALLTFDVGVGYALWTSLAGVGITVLGVLLFGERVTWRKAAGMVLVIGGVVGLQLTGGSGSVDAQAHSHPPAARAPVTSSPTSPPLVERCPE